MAVSVVIPVYESARILPALLQRVTVVLDRLGGAWEIILVNDGSPRPAWAFVSERMARAEVKGTGGEDAGAFAQEMEMHPKAIASWERTFFILNGPVG